jgi:hypothetical protein
MAEAAHGKAMKSRNRLPSTSQRHSQRAPKTRKIGQPRHLPAEARYFSAHATADQDHDNFRQYRKNTIKGTKLS